MTDVLPFLPKNTMSQEQNRILALAAVFQAAQLVHVTATAGLSAVEKLGMQYVDAMIQASLNLRASTNPNQNSLQFFQSIANLQVGLHSLERSFDVPYTSAPKGPLPRTKSKQSKLPLSYTMALLHLSGKIYPNPNFQTKINLAQQNIIRQLSFFNHDYHHPSILSALAQLYSDTASTIKPRIMIKGSANAFNNPHEVAYIRALLFSGLQAAHYWRELGGSPWQLIFSKRKILTEIKHFAELQYQT